MLAERVAKYAITHKEEFVGRILDILTEISPIASRPPEYRITDIDRGTYNFNDKIMYIPIREFNAIENSTDVRKPLALLMDTITHEFAHYEQHAEKGFEKIITSHPLLEYEAMGRAVGYMMLFNSALEGKNTAFTSLIRKITQAL